MSQLRKLLPSLNTLIAFEAAVRCGTFARAARELGVTSPAVSRTIGRLEGHLGVSLFHRTPTGAVLTKDGSELFEGISQSFGEIERTLTRLRRDRPASLKPVVLSVSTAFATHWFMPRFSQFQAQFPGQEIRFDLISGLLGGPVGDADIAMRFDHKPDGQHQVRTLMPESLLPIRMPSFGAPEAQEQAELPADAFLRSGTKVITLDEAQPDWSSLFTRNKKLESSELQFSDYTLVVQAALVGQGVALGWLNVVSHLLAQGSLVPASPTVVHTRRHCELVTRRGANCGVVDDICDWMIAELRQDISRIHSRYPSLDIRS
ncbi:LysR family transcriptional regulator [Xanthobacter aminoxidans]|uniref:LysR family transcriptional regulator n=1 Tax=Xanthobacter aminoxidans TaxID=186280 RepID=UPI003729B05D